MVKRVNPESQNTKLNKPVDVVFLQDTTGSQGPYIQAARKAIRDICDKISAASDLSEGQIRFGLIAFRDHPPQDSTYVTRSFGFTSDVNIMQNNLSSLIAAGGGDGPEAQTAAIAAAMEMDWKQDAVKMVILITDSPPHGIGEANDGFSESPDQNDPLELARQMSEKGMTLFVIACEPSLSNWTHALDFYTALAQITSGHLFPLLMADKLGDFIVGAATETIETEKLITQFEQVIVDDVYNKEKAVVEVMADLQNFMKEKGTTINSVVVDDVYMPSPKAQQNVDSWYSARSIGKAREKVAVVHEPRMKPVYRAPERTRSHERKANVSAVYKLKGTPLPVRPPAEAVPTPAMQLQQLTDAQAHRVVFQSMARASAVSSIGMVSRATGRTIPLDTYSPGPILSPAIFPRLE